MKPFRATSGLPVYDTWIQQGWGVFGWLELAMPSWLYGVLAGACGLVAVASAAIIARFRDRIRWSLVAFFALAVAGLLFGLHYTEYRSIVYGEGPILQGRYLLPVAGLFGLAVALILTRFPPRWRHPRAEWSWRRCCSCRSWRWRPSPRGITHETAKWRPRVRACRGARPRWSGRIGRTGPTIYRVLAPRASPGLRGPAPARSAGVPDARDGHQLRSEASRRGFIPDRSQALPSA